MGLGSGSMRGVGTGCSCDCEVGDRWWGVGPGPEDMFVGVGALSSASQQPAGARPPPGLPVEQR